jgi:dipeptidyl aminopeptidase/acylaminoacyl peptidase
MFAITREFLSTADRRSRAPRVRKVETVRIRAADGALLEAWLFTPASPNGGVRIVLHGVADAWMGVLEHARFLLDAGYTVQTP